ncbi:hypothetical protein [Oceaniglobus roseus]|uniref:hypothetical protein n=1 Tax=Oceaniglobus roseus TaxID=1737570 RepID=UPI0015628F42|nr:hypothetical protein [Kandeliimicrobium roseum]
MTIKTLLAASVLALAPGLAMAAGCMFEKKTVMTCADGYVLDTATGTCVAQATS